MSVLPGSSRRDENAAATVRDCPECGQHDEHLMMDGEWICHSCGHVALPPGRYLAAPWRESAAANNHDAPGSPSAAPPLKHGDRVTITAAWHPWKGHSGTLIEQPPTATFKWVVEMDDGYSMRAQVKEDEVTRV